MVNKRFDSMEKILEARLGEEVNKLILKIDMNRAEFIDVRDNHDNKLMVLEERTIQINDKFTTLQKIVNDQLERLEEEQKQDKEKKQREQEVKKVLDDMLNKIASDKEKTKEE
jgi:gas vesicle protein